MKPTASCITIPSRCLKGMKARRIVPSTRVPIAGLLDVSKSDECSLTDVTQPETLLATKYRRRLTRGNHTLKRKNSLLLYAWARRPIVVLKDNYTLSLGLKPLRDIRKLTITGPAIRFAIPRDLARAIRIFHMRRNRIGHI